MTWSRRVLWRLSILALPWQTRWMWGGEVIEGGYVPESTIYAVYASWIIILLCWLFAPKRESSEWNLSWAVVGGICLLAAIALQPTWYALQWLSQIFILFAFADATRRLRIGRTELTAWSVLALVPHALLAVSQFDAQTVAASKWFGIAAQDPARAGVSVIEVAGERVLRAYGGFPHPNVAGAFFAFALGGALWLARMAAIRWQIFLAWISCAIFPFALVLTFSRSAWLMAGILLVGLGYRTLRRPIDVFFLRPFVIAVACLLIASVLAWPVIQARNPTSPTRLEQASSDERLSLPAQVLALAPRRPIAGYGIGSSIPTVFQHGFGLQPPHMVPLIALLETGLLGLIGLVLLAFQAWKAADAAGRWSLFSLIPALFLDHYFWSLWAGLCLLFFVVFWSSASVDKATKRL